MSYDAILFANPPCKSDAHMSLKPAKHLNLNLVKSDYLIDVQPSEL